MQAHIESSQTATVDFEIPLDCLEDSEIHFKVPVTKMTTKPDPETREREIQFQIPTPVIKVPEHSTDDCLRYPIVLLDICVPDFQANLSTKHLYHFDTNPPIFDWPEGLTAKKIKSLWCFPVLIVEDHTPPPPPPHPQPFATLINIMAWIVLFVVCVVFTGFSGRFYSLNDGSGFVVHFTRRS